MRNPRQLMGSLTACANTFRPSDSVTVAAFAAFDPSLARNASTVISSPNLSDRLLQPSRIRPFGFDVSIIHCVALPSGPRDTQRDPAVRIDHLPLHDRSLERYRFLRVEFGGERVMRGRMSAAEKRCSDRDQERMNSGPHRFSIVFSVQPLHVIAVS
jgi:hypothetical protein